KALKFIFPIGEFSLKFSSEVKPNLFAESPYGKIVPVARVAENQYQVNWIEDVKRSSNGSAVVRLFEEEGYSTLHKVQRDRAKASNVKSITDVTVTTEGAYKRPWIKAELKRQVKVEIITLSPQDVI
ncbi:translocon-associated protein subunit delta-like, partial [Glossina fuscipes]|uniref:Translocon-associated protein subunit delta n=1 Tax=Glossina fuscipes TaxID=7396 RepID=A0A9C5Z571_9MUSC